MLSTLAQLVWVLHSGGGGGPKIQRNPKSVCLYLLILPPSMLKRTAGLYSLSQTPTTEMMAHQQQTKQQQKSAGRETELLTSAETLKPLRKQVVKQDQGHLSRI